MHQLCRTCEWERSKRELTRSHRSGSAHRAHVAQPRDRAEPGLGALRGARARGECARRGTGREERSDRIYHAKTDVRSARANSNTRPKFSTTQASIVERSPADPGSWAWLQRTRCCRREQLRAGAVQPRCWDSGRPVAERTPAGRCCRFAARASPTHAPASPRSTFYRRSTRDP